MNPFDFNVSLEDMDAGLEPFEDFDITESDRQIFKHLAQDAILHDLENKNAEHLRLILKLAKLRNIYDGLYYVTDKTVNRTVNKALFTLGVNADLNWINVSEVTTLSGTFSRRNCNPDVSRWDTSNVINTNAMCRDNLNFNCPLNDWDMSHVVSMNSMFRNAKSFNQPLDKWDTSHVQYTQYMFQNAETFNQPLNNWDVSNIINCTEMFDNAKEFNQPLDKWDLKSAECINDMFSYASKFNQDISGWKLPLFSYHSLYRGFIFFRCPIKPEFIPKKIL